MKKFCPALFLFLLPFIVYGQPQYGQVTQDKINIRVDSTIASPPLTYLDKGDQVEIIGENYDWYKIRLPQSLSCYAWAEYVEKIGPAQGKVRVGLLNLRSEPALDSYIIGQVKKGELLSIRADARPAPTDNGEGPQWLRVKAYPYAAAWIHKKFVKKLEQPAPPSDEELIQKLAEANMAKKKAVHAQLIQKGQAIVPLLLASLADASPHATFSIIHILSQIAKEELRLTLSFLDRIDADSPVTAGVYLDIVQDAIQPEGEKIAYYCQAQEGGLSAEQIAAAKEHLGRLAREELNIAEKAEPAEKQ